MKNENILYNGVDYIMMMSFSYALLSHLGKWENHENGKMYYIVHAFIESCNHENGKITKMGE